MGVKERLTRIFLGQKAFLPGGVGLWYEFMEVPHVFPLNQGTEPVPRQCVIQVKIAVRFL